VGGRGGGERGSDPAERWILRQGNIGSVETEEEKPCDWTVGQDWWEDKTKAYVGVLKNKTPGAMTISLPKTEKGGLDQGLTGSNPKGSSGARHSSLQE